MSFFTSPRIFSRVPVSAAWANSPAVRCRNCDRFSSKLSSSTSWIGWNCAGALAPAARPISSGGGGNGGRSEKCMAPPEVDAVSIASSNDPSWSLEYIAHFNLSFRSAISLSSSRMLSCVPGLDCSFMSNATTSCATLSPQSVITPEMTLKMLWRLSRPSLAADSTEVRMGKSASESAKLVICCSARMSLPATSCTTSSTSASDTLNVSMLEILKHPSTACPSRLLTGSTWTRIRPAHDLQLPAALLG
mmetsp:Transcript_116881/g.277667  ORF Transcript_116881/g.277667 Transcript_116881/m.277667 type:complete len:248 (-) Transcript_116881:986-1729(-)